MNVRTVILVCLFACGLSIYLYDGTSGGSPLVAPVRNGALSTETTSSLGQSDTADVDFASNAQIAKQQIVEEASTGESGILDAQMGAPLKNVHRDASMEQIRAEGGALIRSDEHAYGNDTTGRSLQSSEALQPSEDRSTWDGSNTVFADGSADPSREGGQSQPSLASQASSAPISRAPKNEASAASLASVNPYAELLQDQLHVDEEVYALEKEIALSAYLAITQPGDAELAAGIEANADNPAGNLAELNAEAARNNPYLQLQEQSQGRDQEQIEQERATAMNEYLRVVESRSASN